MLESTKSIVREQLNAQGILVDSLSEDPDSRGSHTSMIIEAHLSNSFIRGRKNKKAPEVIAVTTVKRRVYPAIPNKVIFNEKKRSTTLLYEQDDLFKETGNCTTYEAVTVKATEDDKYDKKLGFLIAYFQKTSGFSKTQSSKYLSGLLPQEEEPKVNTKEIRRKALVGLKVPELKLYAKKRGLRGYSKLKKKELVEFIVASIETTKSEEAKYE